MSDYPSAIDRAEQVRLAVFDVDGVFTDGSIIYSSEHGEIKIFHAHDGLGLKLLMDSGCKVAIVSSRESEIVTRRFSDLGINEIHQNSKNKADTLQKLMNKFGLQRSNIAYTGDDLVDVCAMNLSGLAIAVANAHPHVQDAADWVTSKEGGKGAVREVCDLILRSQGKLDMLTKELTELKR